jgi:hypothetical protein
MLELDERFATLIELLQADGASADLMGPVPEDEIVAAERELGVIFPSNYRRFIRHFGAGNVLAYEIYGLPRDRCRCRATTSSSRRTTDEGFTSIRP